MSVMSRCLGAVVVVGLQMLLAHQAQAGKREPEIAADRILEITDCLVGYRAWVPHCEEPLRGVIVGSMGANWDYRHFVDRPAWRAAGRHWRFALVGTDNRKKAALKKGDVATGEDLLKALARIGDQSGHTELTNAAICSFGFSRGAGYSMALARALPQRVLSIGCGGSNPAWGFTNAADRAVCSVPILLTQGDKDDLAGNAWFTSLPDVRALGYRAALAGQWGLSHFEGNYENLMLIHFDAAIKERLDPEWDPAKGPPMLRSVPLDEGWLGRLDGCEKWSTRWTEVKPATEIASGDRAKHCWFINETVARVWQAYAPQQNSVMLRLPFCDSVDYIASRELTPPHPADKPIELEAVAYWFSNVVAVDFFAGAERIAHVEHEEGDTSNTWTGMWSKPKPGVHAIYAVFLNDKGTRCPTKPCPVVVTE